MVRINAHERRFIARLVNVRRLRKLTQQQLADACGLHRAVVTAIETGERGVRLGEAVDLCAALDVELAEMVGEAPMALRIETPVD